MPALISLTRRRKRPPRDAQPVGACPDCDGAGEVLSQAAPVFADLSPCTTCDGAGRVARDG